MWLLRAFIVFQNAAESSPKGTGLTMGLSGTWQKSSRNLEICSLKVDECNQIWIGLMRFSLFHIEAQKPSRQSPGLVLWHQRQGTIMGGRVDPVGGNLDPVSGGGPPPNGSTLLETSSFMFCMVGPGHLVWGSWWEIGRTRSEDL